MAGAETKPYTLNEGDPARETTVLLTEEDAKLRGLLDDGEPAAVAGGVLFVQRSAMPAGGPVKPYTVNEDDPDRETTLLLNDADAKLRGLLDDSDDAEAEPEPEPAPEPAPEPEPKKRTAPSKVRTAPNKSG